MSKAITYDLVQDYKSNDPQSASRSPGWCMAVYRLGKPVTYSRAKVGSIVGSEAIVSGAYERKAEPLIIFDDCTSLSVSGSKSSHTKVLSATLRAGRNYLSSDNILTGDWVLAWCHNDVDTTKRLIERIKKGEACNDFGDGLKFVGRVHSVRKTIQMLGNFSRSTTYFLQAMGFDELNTYIFYDPALASEQMQQAMSSASGAWAAAMAELDPNLIKLLVDPARAAGDIKDNVSYLINGLIDIIMGSGVKGEANTALKTAYNSQGMEGGQMKTGARQAQVLYSTQDGVPFSYIVPVSVAKILGREVYEKSKKDVFSYADILETIIGVQEYGGTPKGDDPSKGFTPQLDLDGYKANSSHKFCKQVLRGTVLPTTEISFINKPLWSILDQMRNPSINEMYTALKPNAQGKILPTLVVRQIPFSTDSIKQHSGFPLTRFLSVPRWKVAPLMVRSLDVGRSNATRFNMVHVYGNASVYENTQLVSLARQIVKNPPIVDFLDIARSGMKPYMQTVTCALPDLIRIETEGKDGGSSDSGARVWMEAIADWTMGSHLTLNGTIETLGIQAPIAEGDNIEFEGLAYHVESIVVNCGESETGMKAFTTTLSLSNGMPIDQNTDYQADFPRYPGFGKTTESLGLRSNGRKVSLPGVNTNVSGDNDALTSQDPGRTIDREL